jgi:hypothetical protein
VLVGHLEFEAFVIQLTHYTGKVVFIYLLHPKKISSLYYFLYAQMDLSCIVLLLDMVHSLAFLFFLKSVNLCCTRLTYSCCLFVQMFSAAKGFGWLVVSLLC